MKKLFVETSGFTERVSKFLDEGAFIALQKQLIANPNRGTVIKGCGGLRKMRLADPKRRKGKRGGARLIYLHVPEANWIFLIDIYDKGEKEDLADAERKILKQLAEQFKRQAAQMVSRQSNGERR